jgi:enoyl-CoA hydratase/carnithine racemase
VTEAIAVERRHGACWITLRRPESLNAMNARMEDELFETIAAASADAGTRVVALRGAGPCFSAGHDVKAMGTRERPGSLTRALFELEKPVVASLHGYALGAALSLALACDLRLAARGAQLGMPFVGRGVVGGTWLLPRVVGLAAATRLLFLGDPVSGEEAERIGLVHRAVDDDALARETEALVARLAAAPTRAIGIMKRAMRESYGASVADGIASEITALERVRETRDYVEGRDAAREKRGPRFEGR